MKTLEVEYKYYLGQLNDPNSDHSADEWIKKKMEDLWFSMGEKGHQRIKEFHEEIEHEITPEDFIEREIQQNYLSLTNFGEGYGASL